MKVSLWAEIHRLHEVEKLSGRAIARRLRCGRKAVMKALARREPPGREEPGLSGVRVLKEISRARYSRPRHARVYVEVESPPGDVMQVDRGYCGTVTVGNTRRRIHVSVAVFCSSRMLHTEFKLTPAKQSYRVIVK